MDKILFIFGNDVLPENMDLNDTKKLFEIAGGNTGNFVYKHYLKSYLLYDKDNSIDILNARDLENIKNIDEKFDKCVVICANQISARDGALLPFYKFFEETKLPIILLGLGAQSNTNYSLNFLDKIPEHLKLFKMLSKKNAIIGCRGRFSYRVLKKIGFKNVFIIGCPSFYKNGLNLKISKNNQSYNKLLVDVSFDWFKNREIWFKLVTQIPNFHVICQSAPENSLYKLGQGLSTDDDLTVLENLFNIKKEIILKEETAFHNNVSLFFTIDDWENFIKNRDFYIGAKIHGCLMHILNGKSGFLIAHDSRTREFAELFKIPHMLWSDLNLNTNIAEIYQNYNSEKLEKNYKKLFYNYLCFLDRCGLKYHFENFQNEFKSNKLSRLKYRLLFKAENISFMLQEGILRKLKLQHSKKIF